MPKLNRRGFLQAVGAVGLTPFLPSIPVRAAAVSGGVSSSKALWASLYANSGSASEFVGFARNMGLSNSAIQGVSARTIGVRMAVAVSTEKLASASVNSTRAPLSSGGPNLNIRDQVENALETLAPNENKETPIVVPLEDDSLVAKDFDDEADQKAL